MRVVPRKCRTSMIGTAMDATTPNLNLIRAAAREDGSGKALGGRPRPVSPGRADASVVRRHLAALREALANLRRHSGATPEMLRADMSPTV